MPDGRDVLVGKQSHRKHRQGPHVADERHAERGHGQAEEGGSDADDGTSAQDPGALATLVARLDGLGAGHAGRPGARGGKELRAERAVEDEAVHEQREGGADEHGPDQIGSPNDERDGDGGDERVARREGGPGDGALGQVLTVDAAHLAQAQNGYPADQHRHERADHRGVRRDAQRRDQVQADDGAADAEQNGQHQGGGFERPRMQGLGTATRGASSGGGVGHEDLRCPGRDEFGRTDEWMPSRGGTDHSGASPADASTFSLYLG